MPSPVLRILRVRSNLKSPDGQPWEVELTAPGAIIIGGCRDGKTMVEDAIRLSNTGTLRRRGKTVRNAREIVTAGPAGDGEVFAESYWGIKPGGTETKCRWSCFKTETRDADGFVASLSTSNLSHQLPDGFEKSVLLWADDMTGALTTGSPQARERLLRAVAPAVLTEADVEAAVANVDPGLGRALQTHRVELEVDLPTGPDRLRGLDRLERLSVLARKRQAAVTATQALEVQQRAEAPLPSEVSRVEADLEAAQAAWDACSAQAQDHARQTFAWAGVPFPYGNGEVVKLISEGYWLPYAPEVPRQGALEVAQHKDTRDALSGASPAFARPDHPIHITLGAIKAGAVHGDGSCPTCGHGAALCGHPVTREALAERAAQVEAVLRESAEQHRALTSAERALRECVQSYCATLHAEPLSNAARQWNAARSASAAVAARQQAAQAPPPTQQTDPSAVRLDYAGVERASQQVVALLLRAAVSILQGRAQGALPEDLQLACRASADLDLQWGIRDANGHVNDWLSGVEEALVIAALCMAAVPEGVPAFYFLPDINVDPAFSGTAVRALSNSPVPWFWTLTQKPKGRRPKGVVYINVAGRKHAPEPDAEESEEVPAGSGVAAVPVPLTGTTVAEAK